MRPSLDAVFPSVETWESLLTQDLVFLARKSHQVHDIGTLRARVVDEK